MKKAMWKMCNLITFQSYTLDDIDVFEMVNKTEPDR